MITRSDYLKPGQSDKKAAHRNYYAQFVCGEHFSRLGQLKERIMASKDEHFNDIPLAIWDQLSIPIPAKSARLLKECGDYPTLCGAVCILKEAANQIRDKIS